MMDVCNAVKEMEKGKIVKSSTKFSYRIVGSLLEVFCGEVWKPTQIGIVDMAHLDFEIVEEHFDLSKNIILLSDSGLFPVAIECVRIEHIKELIKKIRNEFVELRDDATTGYEYGIVGMEKQLGDGLLRLEARLDKLAGERFK